MYTSWPRTRDNGFNQSQFDKESSLTFSLCRRRLQCSQAEKQLQHGRHPCPREPRRSHCPRPARFRGSAQRLQRPHQGEAGTPGHTMAHWPVHYFTAEMDDFHFSVWPRPVPPVTRRTPGGPAPGTQAKSRESTDCVCQRTGQPAEPGCLRVWGTVPTMRNSKCLEQSNRKNLPVGLGKDIR